MAPLDYVLVKIEPGCPLRNLMTECYELPCFVMEGFLCVTGKGPKYIDSFQVQFLPGR